MANYSKTAKGHEEVEMRKHGLSPRLRRVLIVADGTKTLDELGQFCRPGELEGILGELVAGGFLSGEPVAKPAAKPVAGSAASTSAPAAPSALSEAQFKQVRQEASRYIYDRMGPAGDVACLEIEKSQDAMALRAALRRIEGMLANAYGERSAQEFARKFGQQLM